MIPIITVTNQPERAEKLKRSALNNGWDLYLINTEWKGFGTKLIATAEFLKQRPDIKSFIFCDAHDVVVLGTPDEFEKKLEHPNAMLFNAEKGCWPPPVQHFQYLYEKHEHGFNYLNSGVYYTPNDLFLRILRDTPIQYETDDQWYYSMLYLFGRRPIELDTEQTVFNCHSFVGEKEYHYVGNRVIVNIQAPIFIHFNGASSDPEFDKHIII